MAQGAIGGWQKPVRRFAHFLSWASKKENAWQKKEDAQGKPQGFPCESFPYRGAAAPQTPQEFLFLRICKEESAYKNRKYSLSVLLLRSILVHLQRSWCRAADFQFCSGEEQISSGNFSSRGLPMESKDSVTPPQIPRKDFCRAKVPCGGRDSNLAARQMDSRIPFQTSRIPQTTTRVPN